MKRRLNGRFLLFVLAAASLAGGCLHVIHGAQVKRAAVGLFNQAEAALKAGRYGKAEDYLSRYLAFRPDSVEGLVMYGRTLEALARSDDARARVVKVHEKTLRRDPGNREVRRRMVDLLMGLGQYSDAGPHVELLLSSSPDSGELKSLLGRCEEAQGRFEEAAALYEAARKAEPSRVEVYPRLAAVLRDHLRAADRADRVMDARQTKDGVVAANGRSALAYLERARYRKRYGVEAPGAAADVARALELAPDDTEVLIAAAGSAEERNDTAGAVGHLRRAVARDPKNVTIYQKLASLEAAAGRKGEAVGWLRRGLEAVPGEPNLRWTLADHLIAAGESAEALSLIDGLRRDGAQPETVDYLEGRVKISRGDWPDAVVALERAQSALTADSSMRALGKRALLLLGECYDRVGNADQRYTAYRRAVAIDLDPDPMWVAARLGLAASLVAMNKLDEAIEQYRIVQARDPSAGAAVARLQILQNLARSDDQQRWDEVEQTLESLDRAQPGSGQVALLRAESLAARKQYSRARQLLEKARAAHPDQVDLWVALATLASREEKPEAGLKVLDDARGALGDRVELRAARAAIWVRLGGPEAVRNLEALEKEADPLPAADRERLRRDLAEAYGRLGESERSASLLAKIAEGQPNDLYVQLALLDLALRSDDGDAAGERVLKRIRAIEGEGGALWRYASARLLIRKVERSPGDRTPLLEARGLLREVETLRPSWSRVPLAEARLDELNGDEEGAVRNYMRAVLERGERSPAAVRRTVELLNQQQRYALAARVLHEIQKQGPLSSELQGLAADVSFQARDYGDALRAAKQAVSEKSNDPRELVWLGQLKAAAGEPAEPTFRRAVALAGGSPDPWLALVIYLAREGQKEKAEAAVKEAERSLPRDQSSLPLAQCYEAVGRKDQAAGLYEAALRARPDDAAALRAVAGFHLRGGRLTEAESCFRRIAETKGRTPDGAYARRQLVILKVAGGDRRRALALLTEEADPGRDPAAMPPADVRVKAQVLAVQPSLARRREAVALLEALADRGAGSEADLLLLAQLYEANGDWPRARQRMQKLLDLRPKNPAYLDGYARALLRHGRPDEAALYLNKLEAVAPQAPRTVDLKARVFHEQGRTPEAVALLKAFARRDDARADAVAQVLEQLHQLADAEQTYRLFVSRSKDPEAVLVLARFLGRHARTKEALDLCDQAWASCPPEAVSDTCLVILYGASDDATQQARVERRLTEAAKARPGSASLQFALASLRILQGRYGDAEATLRAIHQRDKATGAPLNNLAWLLALSGGRADEALALVGQAIDLDGETPDLLDTRAVALMAAGKHAAAVRDLEDAVAVRPTAEIYYHLARAYAATGKQPEAAESLKKARSLGLTAESLHPLERGAFAQLAGGLARK